LRPAQANSSQDPISKITRAKWSGDVAQVVDPLPCKHEFKTPVPPKKKKKKKNKVWDWGHSSVEDTRARPCVQSPVPQKEKKRKRIK
jgi:hypothetical protein